MVGFHLYDILEKAEQQAQKKDQWLSGAEGKGDSVSTKGKVEIFWGDRTKKKKRKKKFYCM